MDQMRPVDHVDGPSRRDAGFFYSPPGWRGWIIPLAFAALIMVNAFIPGGWVVNLVGSMLVVVVIFILNAVLKRALRSDPAKASTRRRSSDD